MFQIHQSIFIWLSVFLIIFCIYLFYYLIKEEYKAEKNNQLEMKERKINLQPFLDFKTKNKQGFTNSEILKLLEKYPDIKVKDFNKAMGVHTCMMIDGEIISYHGDVQLALILCLEKREPKSYEWD